MDLVSHLIMGLPGGLAVKNTPATQEKQVRSLGWEEPLEEDIAIHSRILGESYGQRSLVGYSP